MRTQVELISCDRCHNPVYVPHLLEVEGVQGEYCRLCATVITKTCGTCHQHFPNAVIRDDVKEFNCSACTRHNEHQMMEDMLRSGYQFH